MRNKTINALIEMGAPACNKGFNFIADVMCLYAEDKAWMSGKMMALYEKVAKMNGTTWSRVERGIRYTFSIILERGHLEAVEKYLTLQNTSNSNLLITFYLKLSQEGKDAD